MLRARMLFKDTPITYAFSCNGQSQTTYIGRACISFGWGLNALQVKGFEAGSLVNTADSICEGVGTGSQPSGSWAWVGSNLPELYEARAASASPFKWWPALPFAPTLLLEMH